MAGIGFGGRKHTDEAKKKMSVRKKYLHIVPKSAFKKGEPAWNKGKKLSEEHKLALRKPHKEMSAKSKMNIRNAAPKGEKSYLWKGGISSRYKAKNAPRPKPSNCEVCGIDGKELKKGICYDHDHKTGKFRGWICARCNSTLGFVGDNYEILINLAEYLKRNTDNL